MDDKTHNDLREIATYFVRANLGNTGTVREWTNALATILLSVRNDASVKERRRCAALFADIEEAAKKATPGPWVLTQPKGYPDDQIHASDGEYIADINALKNCANGPYVVAANPAALLSKIAAIREGDAL